jgi:hypothetical protein
MNATSQQIRQFRAILAKLKIMDMKDDIVLDASDGRTEHASELSQDELQQLIETLNEKSFTEETELKLRRDYKANNMRKRIFSICHQIGWIKWSDDKNKMIVDIDKLTEWLKKYGYLHKNLNDYKYNELPKLINQFENVFKNYLNQ